MRVKTSVSLTPEVLERINHLVSSGERSIFIEDAVWMYLEHLKRGRRDEQDLQKINSASDFLNAEALDSLGYQVPL